MEFERLIAYFDGDISGLERAGKQATAIVDSVENRFKNLKAELKINTITGNRGGTDAAMRAAQTDIKRMQAETARGEKLVSNAVRAEAKLQSDIKIGEIRRADAEARRSANRMIADLKRVRTEQASASGQSSSFGAVFKGSALGGFAANVAVKAISMTVDALKQGAAAWLEYSSNLEQAKIGFTTMTGSMQAAEQHLKDLQTFAAKTPFQFAELVSASQKMQGVGFSAKEVIPILNDVGNALSAAGRIGDLPFAIKALGDIKAKGKLAGQEIIQLANAGIPIRDVLAKSLNKSTAEIVEMGERGQISADLVFAALHKMSTERFGDAMIQQSRTFAGAMSNITDILYIVSNEAFKPFYDKISKLAVDFADEIQAQGNDFEAVGNVVGKYIGKGLGLALAESAKGLGALLAKVISEDTKTNPVDVFVRNIGVSFAQGLGISPQTLKGWGVILDGTEDFKENLKKGSSELDKITALVSGAPSLDEKTKAAQAAANLKDATKNAEKIREVIKDLTLNLRFYGDSSQEAAVKQRLLAQGIDKSNAGLARQAVSLARQLDEFDRMKRAGDIVDDLRLKIQFYGDRSQEAAVKQQLLAQGITDLSGGSAQAAITYARMLDELENTSRQTDKIKDLREEMEKMRSDADFKLNFPQATELDRFNNWVKQSAANFRELKGEIELTAQKLKNLMIFDSAKQRTDLLKGFSESINQLKKEVEGASDEYDFGANLKKMLEPLGLSGADMDKITRDAETRIRSHYEALQKVRNKEEQEFLDNLVWSNAQDFLSQFKNKEGIQIFPEGALEKGEAGFSAYSKFIELWNTLIALRKKAFSEGESEFSADLTGSQIEAERQRIEMMKSFGADRESIRQAELALERRKETESHRLRLAEIARERDALLKLAQYDEEKLRLSQTYNAQIEAENQRHHSAMGQITADLGKRSIVDRMRAAVGELPSYKQQFEDFAAGLPTMLGDAFAQGMQNWDGSWRGFLEGMKRSFAQTLMDLTSQLIRSALIKMLTSLLGSAFGGAIGGGGGTAGIPAIGGGHAAGGMIPAKNGGQIVTVGEGGFNEVILTTDPKYKKRTAGLLGAFLSQLNFDLTPAFAAGGFPSGPEIFVPSRTQMSENSSSSRSPRNGNAQVVNNYNTINQNIAAPRGTVSPKSRRQVAESALSGVASLTKGKNG